MSGPKNLHASACVLADRGLLVMGPSGSGKTMLVLGLIDRFRCRGRHAALVADDQLLVESHAGKLLCRRPASIAGLAEIGPLGPMPVESLPAAIIDLAVELVPTHEIGRVEEARDILIEGVAIPSVRLPARSCETAALAVMALLREKLNLS